MPFFSLMRTVKKGSMPANIIYKSQESLNFYEQIHSLDYRRKIVFTYLYLFYLKSIS